MRHRSCSFDSYAARLAAGCLLVLLAAPTGGEQTDEVPLLGPLSREEIESSLPDWVSAEMEATPDVEAARRLASAVSGADVTVFLGTWCSDSKALLARLWRGFDEAGVVDPGWIRYIGIDRSKREPREWLGGRDILLVPTLIVEREGSEIGRIVETAPQGVEIDLAAILTGERTGLVTGSAEELAAAESEEPR